MTLISFLSKSTNNNPSLNKLFIETWDGLNWNLLGSFQLNISGWNTYYKYLTNTAYINDIVKIRFRAEESQSGGSNYLNDLLSSQDDDTDGIKIFVSEPGTPRAETCIAYAKKDEDFSSFRQINEFKFSLFLEEKSLEFLKNLEKSTGILRNPYGPLGFLRSS